MRTGLVHIPLAQNILNPSSKSNGGASSLRATGMGDRATTKKSNCDDKQAATGTIGPQTNQNVSNLNLDHEILGDD